MEKRMRVKYRVCPLCGKHISWYTNPNRKYCCGACSHEASKERNRVYYRQEVKGQK